MNSHTESIIARLDRQACLSSIPHDPNFISSIEIRQHDKSYDVLFVACFPSEWSFLSKRVFKALPNSVMIEAISQAAMIAFKVLQIDGLPATAYITNIRNHAPFFDYQNDTLAGSFCISRLRQDSRGYIGQLSDVTLKAQNKLIMSAAKAGFRVFCETEDLG